MQHATDLHGFADPRQSPAIDGVNGVYRQARVGLIAALSVFIMFAPAAGQIFGFHSMFLREWIMFSGSGVGVLKGQFTVHRPPTADQHFTPLSLLALKQYPLDPPDEFGRLIFSPNDLRTYAAATCDGHAGPISLSFDGWVGTRHGWSALSVDDICALDASAPPDSSSIGEPVR